MTAYDELMRRAREMSLLGSTGSLVAWDQETMMPRGAVEVRSQQLAQLASLSHRWLTDPEVDDLLAACEADEDLTSDPNSAPAANVRLLRHGHDRATKLPAELVAERSRTRSMAQHAWQEARERDDFDHFRPWLEKNLALAREAASCYGWPEDGEAWDALAEGYERGMTASGVAEVFAPLRERLAALVDEIRGASGGPTDRFARVKVPEDAQASFVREVAEAIGFDFARGRQDISTHPFCSGLHPKDVRMTTRFGPDDVGDALGSTMHEAGHGIYEQGLPPDLVLQPAGRSVSLGIHESQSRMWENQVGRSEPFWRWCHPLLARHFGSAFDDFSPDEVYAGMNRVEPSLIRVEADEATYNLHVMVRFDLERALIAGDLEAGELPEAWNAAYADHLGVDVPDDRRGCLQDVHWSMGAFGYFPTYTLGNLYCAQLFEAAERDVGELPERFARGEFAPLKDWLNVQVHERGARYEPDELCEAVTGEALSAEPLLRHLEGKLRPIYGI